MIAAILAKIKPFWICALIFFLLGAYVTNEAHRWFDNRAAERMFNEMVKAKDAERMAALDALNTYHEMKPNPVETQYITREVIKHVPSNPVCDVTPAERMLLNQARTGRRTTDGIDEGDSGVAAVGTLPRGVEVTAHIAAGEMYRELRAQCTGLQQYVRKLKDASERGTAELPPAASLVHGP